LIVFSAVPRADAICLFEPPAITCFRTSRSRVASVASRACVDVRSAIAVLTALSCSSARATASISTPSRRAGQESRAPRFIARARWNVGFSAQEYDRGVIAALAQHLLQLQPIHAGHGQIEDDASVLARVMLGKKRV
jgi:hypothetical protein